MGSGTFISKQTVERFTRLQELGLVQEGFEDAYFVTYMNQVPYQLEGHGPMEGEILSEEEKTHVHNSLMTLYRNLQGDHKVFSTDEDEPNIYGHDARTACHDDRCLFLTNVEIFPDIRLFSYDSNIGLNDSERIHSNYFDKKKFISHPYSSAVDGNDKTAWKALRHIKSGDYIGLDMLRPMPIALNFRILAQHPYAYRRSLSVRISKDGEHWHANSVDKTEIRAGTAIHCRAFDPKDEQLDVADLLECRFSIKETGYRFMRLESKHDLDFEFKIHDLSFGAKARRDKNGQLLEVIADEDGIFYVEDKDD
ncbi:hypothetical protein EC973_002843 [Apophysomyces ossiformis]|uniref:Uncharacterized protein n=1 Tax=Apophysomyces ossiformis TaxID=679940 RepID=A0A8H7EMC2_9FUNG|nr:hypothetical protein EC973_002843 [Apophysomyces ossiformis]